MAFYPRACPWPSEESLRCPALNIAAPWPMPSWTDGARRLERVAPAGIPSNPGMAPGAVASVCAVCVCL